ncbi:Hypothetical protein A7982_02832 [Minicystis rosea]|nr:Hypothetical protein A7982_02832 [Minicystis rosea]
MQLLLVTNAVAQVLFSCLFGWAMLVPMQPWGQRWRNILPVKAALAAHLDWIMLGLAQGLVAYASGLVEPRHPTLVTALLVFGGWVNPVPYLLRAKGTDAFVLAGGLRQRAAALLAGTSSLALTIGFSLILVDLVRKVASRG